MNHSKMTDVTNTSGDAGSLNQPVHPEDPQSDFYRIGHSPGQSVLQQQPPPAHRFRQDYQSHSDFTWPTEASPPAHEAPRSYMSDYDEWHNYSQGSPPLTSEDSFHRGATPTTSGSSARLPYYNSVDTKNAPFQAQYSPPLPQRRSHNLQRRGISKHPRKGSRPYKEIVGVKYIKNRPEPQQTQKSRNAMKPDGIAGFDKILGSLEILKEDERSKKARKSKEQCMLCELYGESKIVSNLKTHVMLHVVPCKFECPHCKSQHSTAWHASDHCMKNKKTNPDLVKVETSKIKRVENTGCILACKLCQTQSKIYPNFETYWCHYKEMHRVSQSAQAEETRTSINDERNAYSQSLGGRAYSDSASLFSGDGRTSLATPHSSPGPAYELTALAPAPPYTQHFGFGQYGIRPPMTYDGSSISGHDTYSTTDIASVSPSDVEFSPLTPFGSYTPSQSSFNEISPSATRARSLPGSAVDFQLPGDTGPPEPTNLVWRQQLRANINRFTIDDSLSRISELSMGVGHVTAHAAASQLQTDMSPLDPIDDGFELYDMGGRVLGDASLQGKETGGEGSLEQERFPHHAAHDTGSNDLEFSMYVNMHDDGSDLPETN